MKIRVNDDGLKRDSQTKAPSSTFDDVLHFEYERVESKRRTKVENQESKGKDYMRGWIRRNDSASILVVRKRRQSQKWTRIHKFYKNTYFPMVKVCVPRTN